MTLPCWEVEQQVKATSASVDKYYYSRLRATEGYWKSSWGESSWQSAIFLPTQYDAISVSICIGTHGIQKRDMFEYTQRVHSPIISKHWTTWIADTLSLCIWKITSLHSCAQFPHVSICIGIQKTWYIPYIRMHSKGASKYLFIQHNKTSKTTWITDTLVFKHIGNQHVWIFAFNSYRETYLKRIY